MTMPTCSGIGVMSGTSLDGLDLAWCVFERVGEEWRYQVRQAVTLPYPEALKQQLAEATALSAYQYARLDVALGEYIAERINDWIGDQSRPDFIASHGHTVFHQPDLGLTTQIGSGAVIAARTGITTVSDFRTTDVALHGQGAPLVPIGDELLYGRYDACLNLGGFSNISFRQHGCRVAFDVSPCNMALNFWANKLQLPYDKGGNVARFGLCVAPLFNRLNDIEYYAESAPKSLGKEWFEREMLPLFEAAGQQYSVEDCLRTTAEHIAFQIGQSLPKTAGTVLVTGGGAHNDFLIELLRQYAAPAKVVVPDAQTVDFKEAIVFAFLGMLRLKRFNNCLRSVTGAEKDCCGGAVYCG